MLSGHSWTGLDSGSSVKADIYREANAYCASLDKEFQPVHDRDVDGQVGRSFANAEVTFRCLPHGDPELHRPTPKQDPNVVIENQH